MTQHLTEDQFIGHTNHTLTDAEREAMDRHLAGCPQCRASLADHEAFARRIQYDLATDLRAVHPSAQMSFRAIAPRMKYSRRLIMFTKQSNQVMVGAATLLLLVALGLGLFMLTNNLSQPEPEPQVNDAEPAPVAVDSEGQPDSAPAEDVNPPTMPVELTFTVYENNPVLAAGSFETLDWDRSGAEPGAIVFHGRQYHMFFNGSHPGDNSMNHAVGYATSPDGVTWTRMVAEPLLTADDVGFAEVGIRANSVFVQDDGVWVVYFSTWNEPLNFSTSDIGRATAPGPEGPWTPDDTPALESGPEGSWDGYAVTYPSVVRTEDGYVMYYTGVDRFFGTQMIGMATSADGLTWTKYDDLGTSEAPFAASDPILLPGEADAWDSKRVLGPSVQQTPDGWVMVYASSKDSDGSGDREIGYATSADGRRWVRAGELPELAELVADWNSVTTLLYHDGTYYLYFTGQERSASPSVIFLATAGQAIGP